MTSRRSDKADAIPEQSPLGKHTDYIFEYQPDLLFPLPRQDKRAQLGIDADALPFHGQDIWNAWEISWLSQKGKPIMCIGRFTLPAESENLIESKSFKLYLNSFNQSRFSDVDEVRQIMANDLSAATGATVTVELMTLVAATAEGIVVPSGENLDDQDVEIDSYTLNPEYLQHTLNAEKVTETLHSNLLKSNCPVTGQPDWGTVIISYTGQQIDRAGLLKYICSFRQHQEFHEQCVERMYIDLLAFCQPSKLSVEARYVRRGGLDINPIRRSEREEQTFKRLVRQ